MSNGMTVLSEAEKETFATGFGSNLEAPSDFGKNREEQKLIDGCAEFCPSDLLEQRDGVSYGEFLHGTYYSETCRMERGYSILLPPSYNTEKKYPVLYLLHGIFGNEYSFSHDKNSRIKELVGNMENNGELKDIIVVCPNMFATTDPKGEPGFDKEGCLPYDNFIFDLTNDLMPYIESEYSVLKGRENTCLAGFSMGGRETIFITLKRPELFGYVCAISSAPGIVPSKDKFMNHEGQMEEEEFRFMDNAIEPEVFMCCCGSTDSVVGKFPLSYHELMEKNGVSHIWYEVPLIDHEITAVHSGLYNLFKRIGN